MPILTGKFDYPDAIEDDLRSIADANVINVHEMAEELGNPKVMNVILLGSVVKNMELTDVDWEKVISENVKPKFIDLNLAAFKKGMEIE